MREGAEGDGAVDGSPDGDRAGGILRRFPPWVWGSVAGLLSTTLYVCAFPPIDASPLALAFAVPFLFWCFFQPSRRTLMVVAGVVSLVAWTVLFWWLRNAPSSTEMPLKPLVSVSLPVLLGAVEAVFLAAWLIPAGVYAPQLLARSLPVRMLGMAGLSGWWVVLEWLRSWVFTGWPWLPLAASQWQNPGLLQILPYTGAYGLSFVIIFFNLGLLYYGHFTFLRKHTGPWWTRFCPEFYAALTVFLGLFALLLIPGYFQLEREPMFKAGIVQPYIEQPKKWDPAYAEETLGVLRDYTTFAHALGAEVVLWPESVTPWPVKGNDSAKRWVEELSRFLGVSILMGNMAVERGADGEEDWYNAAFSVSPESGVALERYYAKRKLVPFGEYVPLQDFLPFLDPFIPFESLASGEGPGVLRFTHEGRALAAGPLICSEDVFPALARETAGAGVDFFLVVTNNAWFGEEGGAHQHAAHSVLRAVENRRPLLRCGNNGWSGFIDEYGMIRHIVGGGGDGIYNRAAEVVPFTIDPRWSGNLTFYTRFGDWFVIVAALLALAAWVGLKLPVMPLAPKVPSKLEMYKERKRASTTRRKGRFRGRLG